MLTSLNTFLAGRFVDLGTAVILQRPRTRDAVHAQVKGLRERIENGGCTSYKVKAVSSNQRITSEFNN